MDGAELIVEERLRQIEQERWSGDHDDEHTDGELVYAAIAYAAHDLRHADRPSDMWPWDASWWKPRDPVRNLVKAGALIAAEIDRLLRLREAQDG